MFSVIYMCACSTERVRETAQGPRFSLSAPNKPSRNHCSWDPVQVLGYLLCQMPHPFWIPQFQSDSHRFIYVFIYLFIPLKIFQRGKILPVSPQTGTITMYGTRIGRHTVQMAAGLHWSHVTDVRESGDAVENVQLPGQPPAWSLSLVGGRQILGGLQRR